MKKIAILALLLLFSICFIACAGAKGEKGDKGEQGIQGVQGEKGEKGDDGIDGVDGITPTIEISEDGYWVINGNKTTVMAKGQDGENGQNGKDGIDGKDGNDGENGKDGKGIESVSFDANGNLVITFTDKTTQIVSLPKKEECQHDFGQPVILKTGDYCDQNLSWRACKTCGFIEWKNVFQEHEWADNWSYTDKYHYKKCKNCVVGNFAEDHKLDENGKCEVCGIIVGSDGLEYSFKGDSQNGRYAIVSGYTGSLEKIIIPDRIQGVPVREISSGAIKYNDSVKAIYIPKTVNIIGDNAFYSCNNLEEIIVDAENENFKSVDGVLYDFEIKTLIEYPVNKANEEYLMPNTVTEVKANTFAYVKNLKRVTLSNNLKVMPFGLFNCCENLETVVIPNSVTEIGEGAFWRCTALATINIPKSVENIDATAFSGCSSLVEILVDQENQFYKSLDGNLLSKNGEIFVRYASGKTATEFSIPETVIEIWFNAFDYDKNLEKVILPTGVEIIGESAFSHCEKLKSINIPSSVILIECLVFSDCEKLAEVIFEIHDNWYLTMDVVNPEWFLIKSEVLSSPTLSAEFLRGDGALYYLLFVLEENN